jgi:GNAT superfamily N-acetyltransferase
MSEIRTATELDAHEICRVLQASIRHLCVADHKGDEKVISAWTANKTSSSVNEWIVDANNVSFVYASSEGKIDGVSMSTRQGNLLLLYVDPQSAGRGVGSKLLTKTEGALSNLGVLAVTADSTQSALTFYQSKGYVWSGKTESFGPLTSYHIEKSF